MVDITPGRYRHFKGNEYEVLGVARHSATLDDKASMWSETVEKDGYRGPRFVPVEEEK